MRVMILFSLYQRRQRISSFVFLEQFESTGCTLCGRRSVDVICPVSIDRGARGVGWMTWFLFLRTRI